MPGATLNVNNDAVVVFARKLEKLSKTAFPNVVRKTLNETAMDVKQNTLPDSAKTAFEEQRTKTFFKRYSRVNFANGKDLRLMAAEVGMSDHMGLKGDNPDAVENMEEQEHGGEIKSRTYIPTAEGRTGKSWGRTTRKPNRWSTVKETKSQWIKTADVRGRSWAEKAVRASLMAGVGGIVEDWHEGLQRNGTVWRVMSIKKTPYGHTFKRIDLFHINKRGKFKVKKKGFAKLAAEKSAGGLEKRFPRIAEKRFERVLS